MADSSIPVTSGSGNNVDTRTNAAGDHRQVVVLGHESATDSVASVQATDPSSSALGLVVRDIHTSIIAQYSEVIASDVDDMNSVGVLIRGANASGRKDILANSDGAIKVYDIVNGTIQVSGITASINVHVLSTGGTIRTKLDPESVISGIQSTIQVVEFTSSGSKVADETYDAKRVLIAGSHTAASLLISGQRTAGTNVPLIVNTDGAIKVYDITTGTIATVTAVTGITNSIQVHLLSTAGTIHVRLADNSAGLATDDLGWTPGTDVGHPIMALFDDTATDSVDEGDAGILRMTANRNLYVHTDSTASIFTVSGSTSGVSPSGVTLVSPSANASFKVFAFSLQTTGIVSTVARFTNGAGSATEFWRGLVTANQTSSTPLGANLAVSPPSFLFATGVSTTLALHLDNASLVHYSVSYFKESA